MRKNYFKVLGIACLMLAFISNTQAQMTSKEAVDRMGRGINMGNTLDAPTEGSWAPVAQDHYFKGYRDAGFTSLRIPITWDQHTGTAAPYDVDVAFMDRVEHLVDLALDNELLVIMNMHHEGWLKEDYNEENLDRFKAIWTQIVERFHMKSDSLLFEPLNEPQGMSRVEADEANAEALAIIRASNPTRKVIISGAGWSAIQDLENMAVPDDEYIIGYYHSYNPWGFGGEGNGTWGTEADISAVKATFQKAADWSTENGVPVIISEF
ncbi:MAG: glycoside hydrolase family 5 protein, partial [Colwellia sp.]